MNDVRRAWKEVRAAWSGVKSTARPIWWILLAVCAVAVILTWLAIESLRWLGLVDLPWWIIPPLAVVVHYLLLKAFVVLGRAVVDVHRGRSGGEK